MKIKKIKPYFIKKVNNDEEFMIIIKELLSDGYRWLGLPNLTSDKIEDFYKRYEVNFYPFYISNLLLIEDNKYLEDIRIEYNQFCNNILYTDDEYGGFDITEMRKEKLLKLKKL